MLKPTPHHEGSRLKQNTKTIKFSKMLRISLFSMLSQVLTQFFSQAKKRFSRSYKRATARSFSRALGQSLARTFSNNLPSATSCFLPNIVISIPKAKARSCALTLSLALTFAPLGVPTYAQAETSNAETSNAETSNNEEFVYDYTFEVFLSNVQQYYLFAGNVGDATNYSDRSDAGSATANNNTFSVENGAAMSSTNFSSSTQYEINGAAAHIALYGDTNSVVTANGNASSISGGYITNLYGAYIGINAIVYNTTIYDDGYIPTTLDTLTANDNSIVMEEGTVGQGLQNQDSGLVLYNVGKSLAAVHVVSYNTNDDATFYLNNNSVYISGGTVVSTIGSDAKEGALTGAYLSTVLGEATMSNNSVTITGGDVQAKRIAGATFYTYSIIEDDVLLQWSFDHHDTSVTMFNNSVTISGADVKFESLLIAGAYANVSNTAEIYNNTVHISAGNFTSTNSGEPIVITGAYLKPIQPSSIDIEANNGAGGYIIEGTVSMKAYGNSVTVTGGIIEGVVSGATIYVEYSDQSKKYINSLLEYEGTISNNTVTVYGGEIKSNINNGTTGIYGGIYQGVNAEDTNNYGDWKITNTYSITNNTVNIGFDASLIDSISIGGGAFSKKLSTNVTYVDLTPNVHTYDGNTLNLYHFVSNNQSVGTIANFENINFVLGESQTNGTTLITAGQLYLGNGYLTDAGVSTATNGGSTTATLATKFANFGLHTSLYNTIATGDEITLLTTTNGIDGNFTNLGANNSGTYTGTKGALLSQTWDIDGSNNSITATLLSTQAGEQSKILGEVSLANMTAITNSTDLLVGSAIPTAYEQIASNLAVSSDSLDSQDSQDSGLIDNSASAAFLVTSGGSSRYNTGSHVDSNSISLNAGIAKGAKGMSGNWLVGGFFEYNYGNYSTYNSFSTGTVEGDGEVYAFGLGGFARYDFEHAIYKPYVEASLRLGYIETDYYTADLLDYSATDFETPLSYDVDNMYFGMHLGVGNVFDINEKLSIDASLKYFWTHQMSENRNLFGHNVDFDAVNSHRVRLSGRASYTLKDDDSIGKLAMYGGLGLEYEFDGKARSYVDGYEAPTPDLQGLTGIGEFGLSFTPNVNSNVSIDLGMQAFTGMREGVSASMQFVLKF